MVSSTLLLLLALPAMEAFATRAPLTSLPRPLGRTRGMACASAAASGAAKTTAKPKLYAYHRSRSKIIEWYCQEIGVEYETAPIAMDLKEHKSAEFLKLNPFGKLPVLEMEDGQPIMESGAILMYLADKYGGLKTPEERALANSWCMFANASLGPAIFVEELRTRQMAELFTVLDEKLAHTPFLLGDSLTVADVATGSYLAYLPRFFPDIKLDAWPKLQAYVAKLSARPAFQNTVGAPPPPQ